jgi:hypothetical protein
MAQPQLSERVHHVIVRSLLDTGACPSNAELQRMLELDDTTLCAALRELADGHGVVLHPSECAPWVIHPFSVTPTATYVESSRHGWWAPCL